jgi:hypothetical protein
MDSINEARTKTARPTSENQMNSPKTPQHWTNRTRFSLECHCLHQKADQTIVKPVCMHGPGLGKTSLRGH